MYSIQDTLMLWKSTGYTLLMLGCLFTPYAVSSSADSALSQNTPTQNKGGVNFVLPDLQGNLHNLTDYKGKVVLVNFWASWCVPCIKEMPELSQLKQRFSTQSFEILAINVGESKNKVTQFVQLMKFNLPVLLDITSDTFNSWDTGTLPSSFFIDGMGDIRRRIQGNPGWDNDEMISLIETLLKETE